MKDFFISRKIFLAAALFLVSAGCNILGSSSALGVIKTYDGGGSWQPADAIANNNQTDISKFAVAEIQFDPQSRSTIYLATVSNGFWISKDSAKTWSQLLSKLNMYDFYVDATDSSNLYAAGIFSNNGRIIRSTDGGKTWEEIYKEASVNNPVNTITANPANTQELYAGLDNGVLIKSIDGGVNWFVVYNFNDQLLNARYDKVNNELLVLTRTDGLFESTDGGQHFTPMTNVLTTQSISQQILLVPKKVDRFVKMGIDDTSAGVIYLTTSNGLFKTTDNGKNWDFINVPIKSSAQLPRAIASSKGGVIAYTSIGNTIFKTIDGGQSWQTQEIPSTNLVESILIDPQLPQISYAGLIDQ